MTIGQGTLGQVNSDRHIVRLILASTIVPLVLSVVSVSASEPTLLSPYPGVQAIFLTSGWSRWLTAGIAPALFLLWVLITTSGRGRRQWWFGVPMGTLTLLDVIYLCVRVPFGLQNQGFAYSALMVVMNVSILTAFWAAWYRWRHNLTVRRLVWLGLISCSWLAWCAFPYFGEGI